MSEPTTDTIISTTSDVVTLINVFTVDPARQQELVDVLDAATVEQISQVAGFVSANIHASLDGTKVTNYAQWESWEHLEAMQADPASRAHMQAAAAIATFEPALYTVRSVHHR